MADETVTQRLEFDASQALQALKEVQETADTVAGKANLLNKHLQDYSRTLGQSWKQTLAQMREIGAEKFGGFSTQTMVNGQVVNKDVTDEVFRQTEALAKATQAKNKFVTEDTNAARAEMNFDGSVKQANAAIVEQAKRIQVLVGELNKLKNPTQGRNALGQFATATPPSFATQFAGLSTYQEQLKLVESTIASLQKKTNLPFKDIGRELGKSFPELLKDTNLVSTAVENLTKQNMGLSASFRTEAETIALVRQKLTELQAAGRLNLTGRNKDVVNNLKGIIKEVSTSTGAQYSQVANQLEAMGVSSAQANAAVKGLNAELTHGTKAAQGMGHSIDIVRTALGTLTAVGIFTFMSFLQKSFTDAVKAARELEDSLFRLHNVEKILSQAGTEVSFKGLQQGIKDIKALFPIFSQEDITQLVAQISISTKELGLTERQILDLAKAVAVLNVRSTEEETATQTAQKVISSLITDNARGIASLGLTFNETAMEAEGMALGIITAKKSLSDLSNEEKAQIKYSILLKNTNGELANMGEYLDTNTAKIKENSASWHDLLTTIGSIFTSLTPLMSPVIDNLVAIANNIKGLIVTSKVAAVEVKLLMASFSSPNPVENLKNLQKTILELPNVFDKVGGVELKKLFPNIADAPEWLRNMFGKIPEYAETATGAVRDIGAEVDTKGLDELSQKLEEIAIDAQHAKEDLDILLAQKQEDLEIKVQLKTEDINTEYLQKAEDAAVDYNNKIADINLDAQQKVEDAKRKAREDEEKAEAEFLLRMKELREDFLMDLEDALHERDARQVLRLIKEYNLDKQKLIDKKALDDQFRKQALEADLKNIEIERQRKLESAAIEYQRKLEQLAVAKQRELDELAVWKEREEQELQRWYQREQEEIDRNTKNKIERLIAGYIEEGKIHEEQQGKIHDILVKWFGQNKALVDQLAGYTAMKFNEMAAMAASAFASVQSMMMSSSGAYNPYVSPTTAGNATASMSPALHLAKGGQFVATRPTNMQVGEGGAAELVTVTPLSKLGSLQNKRPVNDGLDGRNGQQRIVLDMNLSPDLEARVVQKSLDGTANVIQRINRSKG